ncbi:T9SS type A sorting domain-containing protein [Taibaiella chishuiensis]|uniref:Putative secreted protein (Por secretion system target) n=1 Tax=Taibaiella chishuiensis TaxID=1434707 RepID=A0A2P8CWD2_9BACT|nr:T9SS type A sorting domain-containing protein [Taibaiella chishuiensis]PSK89250.1 putative secreted protein (Por secretion system target) [Taibaiella chishuiensis]
MFQSNPIKNLITAALLAVSLPATATIYINTNTTWNTSFALTDKVEIQPGATLTISGANTVITCSPGVYIKVLSNPSNQTTPAGGRLVINDATLTGTAGNNGWEGIYTVGKKTLSQQDTRMSKTTLNNALIEKCIYGVRNWDFQADFGAFSTGGGIVQISNSRFHNNTFSVYLHSYENFSKTTPTIKLADYSFINKSRFYFDNTTDIPTGGTAPCINMHHVEGVKVQGNTFYRDPNFMWGGHTAVYLESSGAVIQPYCNDNIIVFGQECTNVTPNTVSNFVRGIYAPNQGEVHAITIDRTQINNTYTGIYITGYQNTKILRNTINLAPANSSGITLEGCSGFRVEQNVIQGSSTTSNNGTYGITVKNSGESYNEIYKNQITNVSYALQANDNNRSTISPANGLMFLCNTMTNAIGDAYDITVTGGTASLTSGIAYMQAGFNGNPLTAGNTFSSFSTSTGAHNLNNAGNGILYYTDPATPATTPAYHNVTLMNGGSNTCPTKIIPPGSAVTTLQQLSAFKAELEATIDGKVNSGEDYSVNLAQYAYLVREMLDRHLSASNGEDVEIHPAEMISLLGSAKYLYDFKVMKAGIEAQQGSFDEAMATLEAIPDEFELNELQQSRLQHVKDMIAVQQGLEEAGNSWSDMDPALRDKVYTIAADDDFIAREMARYYLLAYEDAVYQPDLRTVSDAVVATPVGTARGTAKVPVWNGMQVYPNPASDRLLIRIPGNETAVAVVTDLAGRILLQPILTGGLNQLDIRSLKPGLYFVAVSGPCGKTTNYKIVKE